MASSRVQVYVKRQLRLDRLSFGQQQMFKLGTVAVAAVKDERGRAIAATGGPAKPLKRAYAIKKTKLGKGNRRTLSLTGDMMRNLQVRTVSENVAQANLTTRKDRIKGLANTRIEEWLAYSDRNVNQVQTAAQQILIREIAPRLILAKALGVRTIS